MPTAILSDATAWRSNQANEKTPSISPAMPAVVISDPASKRRRRSKIYGVRTFMDPGCPTDFSGAFRDNVRRFIRECADLEERAAVGMPTWSTMLVDEKSGAVVPLYTVEEIVQRSPPTFCDHCRRNGWSHHFVSKRKYHIIIPADDEWDKPLNSDSFRFHNNLLHGLVHCNGFGHLLLINGREGGSHFLSGRTLMDLWDRLCTSLRIREVTVEDASQKYSVDLRLLFGMAYGVPWFARWGYCLHSGRFSLPDLSYADAIDHLSFLPLDSLLAEAKTNDIASARDLRQIVTSYGDLHNLSTVRELFRHLIASISAAPQTTKTPQPSPRPPSVKKKRTRSERRKKCRDFKLVASELDSRWPVRRLVSAAQVVVDALVERGSTMTRQEVRDAARLVIGDTGLIDFVLKSIGNVVVDRYIVRRRSNPSNRVLEFSLDKLPASRPAIELVDDNTSAPFQPSPLQDLQAVYKCVVAIRPDEARTVLDARQWVKTFELRDEADDLLRFYVQWVPGEDQTAYLTRPLPPPELVVLDPHASIGDLKSEAESGMRDTYHITSRFRISSIGGVKGEWWEPVMLAGVESGAEVWVTGEGVDTGCELKYEGGGGGEGWDAGCGCCARDVDGERMVACDACDVWHHTRCIGIEDGEPVPQLFVCAKCGSLILEAAAAEEEGMEVVA